MKALALVTVLLCGIHQEHDDSIHLTVDDIPHRPVIVYPVIPIKADKLFRKVNGLRNHTFLFVTMGQYQKRASVARHNIGKD